MKKFIPLIFGLTCLVSAPAVAQEAAPDTASGDMDAFPQREWQVAIDAARADTKAILDENEKLNEEYTFLQERLSGLNADMERLKKEIGLQEEDNKRLTEQDAAERRKTQDLDRQLTDLQKQAAAMEAENKDLVRRLGEVEEKNRVWQAQLDQLDAQKRGLQLDLKMQQVTQEETHAAEGGQLKTLREELESYQAQEAELNTSVKNLEDQRDKMKADIETLDSDNRFLEKKIAELKRRQDEQSRRNQTLEKEQRAAARSGRDIPPALAKEKQSLETEITALEQELEALRRSVADSKGRIEQKRALMNEIMTLDSENQKLRGEIADILKANAAASAQLDAEPLDEGDREVQP